MSVIIKEVTSKKLLKQWVDFPTKLYKGNKYFCPFLRSDEINTFTKGKNPAYEFCDTKLFLAYKDNKIVGRIAGLNNRAYNKKWGKNAVRFTRFDFIDDFEVSTMLFNEVVKWAKEQNFSEIMGPIGFTDMDHSGVLVEGFEELNLSITFYNFPYYIKHYENLGLKKDKDWVEFQITVPKEIDERYKKISNYIIERNGFKLVTYTKRKDLIKDAPEAFKVIDEAFSVLYGTVPLTDGVIKDALDNYMPIVNLKYICSVKDKNNNIIGFAVMVPSLAKAFKQTNGKLFPFGFINVLNALNGKNDTLEMYFVAVKQEYQSKGITSILLQQSIKACIENGIKICETGPELEDNNKVQSMWKGLDARLHRRRRCYIKNI